MARYRGVVSGSRGVASRLGTPGSGLHTEANGWNVGINVIIGPDALSPEKDRIGISLTGGSNKHTTPLELFRMVEGQKVCEVDLIVTVEGGCVTGATLDDGTQAVITVHDYDIQEEESDDNPRIKRDKDGRLYEERRF